MKKIFNSKKRKEPGYSIDEISKTEYEFKTLGEKIRFHRTKQHLSQKQLGDLVRCSESAIRNYELGNRYPERKTIYEIADALKISYEYLFDSSNDSIQYFYRHFIQIQNLTYLKPVKIENKLYLELLDSSEISSIDIESNLYDSYLSIQKKLSDWCEAYNLFYNDGTDNYILWCSKYPKYAHIENGKLVLTDSNGNIIDDSL